MRNQFFHARSFSIPGLLQFAVVGVMLGFSSTPVFAQDRKAPPPEKEQYEYEAPDIELWAKAYNDFNAPQILVMCGWSKGIPTAAAGESTYFSLNESPFAVQLQGAFIDVINDPRANVYLVDNGAVRDTILRLQNNLLNNSEAGAMRLLGNELEADLIVQIQLIDKKSNDTPNRVRFQAIDPTNGRTLTTKVFEWKLGSSTADVKQYAEQIARLFINDIAGRTQSVARYNLRIFGPMGDARLGSMFKYEIGQIMGVERVKSRSNSTGRHPVSGDLQAIARFDVSYTGDFMDLSAEVANAIGNIDDVDVRVLQAAGNQITLKVTPIVEVVPKAKEEPVEEHEDLPVTTFKGCIDLLLDPTYRGERFRDELQTLYRKQDSPSIAVLVNREPSVEEKESSSGDGGKSNRTRANTIVMVNSAGRDVDNRDSATDSGQSNEYERVRRISQLERQTNLVESALFKRLGPELLSFERKDASTARSSLIKHMEKQSNVYGQDELVQVLRQLDIADVVIFGSGADLPEKNGLVSVTYTFRAIQISDAGVLGVASAREMLDGRSEFDIAEAIADRAIKDLICEMKQSWSPPNELDIMLTSMSNSDDLALFLQTVEGLDPDEEGVVPLEIVGRTAYEGAEGQGHATVTIRYRCSFNDLFGVVRELAGQLPYDLDIQSMDASQAKLMLVR